MLRVADLETGRTLHRLSHGSSIFSLDVSPDGRRALTGGGPTFRVWDLELGVEIASHRAGGLEAVHAFAALGGGGRRVVFGSEQPRVTVWDLEAGQQVASFPLESEPISSLAVSRDGLRAVAAFAHGHLALIDLVTGKALRTIPAHEDWVRDLRITPDDRHVVSLAQDHTLRIHALDSGAEITTPFATAPIAAISLDRSGRLDAADLGGGIVSLPSNSNPTRVSRIATD